MKDRGMRSQLYASRNCLYLGLANGSEDDTGIVGNPHSQLSNGGGLIFSGVYYVEMRTDSPRAPFPGLSFPGTHPTSNIQQFVGETNHGWVPGRP